MSAEIEIEITPEKFANAKAILWSWDQDREQSEDVLARLLRELGLSFSVRIEHQ